MPGTAFVLLRAAPSLELVLGAGGVLLVLVVVVALAVHGGRRPAPVGGERPAPQPMTQEVEDMPIAAVVVNPTKFDDMEAARETVTSVCTQLGWGEPLWFETTEEDTGEGQTRQALEAGADVVIAAGGDGTVRAVAQVMAGSGTATALLPAGTGNLLARNMEMTLDDLRESTRIALTGDDRRIDVGWMRIDGTGREQVFLVMAGMGFDAEIMANAPEALKARVGPAAYVVAGLRHFNGARTRMSITVDDSAPITRRIRTVVIGNCGKLLGGLVLMPDAELDDGKLDMVSIAPSGIVGWAAVAGRVMTRQRRGHHRVEHWQAQRIVLQADQPHVAQLDGDPVGEATCIEVRVDPGALVVRVDGQTPKTLAEAARGAAQSTMSRLTAGPS